MKMHIIMIKNLEIKSILNKQIKHNNIVHNLVLNIVLNIHNHIYLKY